MTLGGTRKGSGRSRTWRGSVLEGKRRQKRKSVGHRGRMEPWPQFNRSKVWWSENKEVTERGGRGGGRLLIGSVFVNWTEAGFIMQGSFVCARSNCPTSKRMRAGERERWREESNDTLETVGEKGGRMDQSCLQSSDKRQRLVTASHLD